MSNARKLADLLDSAGDIKSAHLDNVPASNNASALTTGTLPIARIADDAITNAKMADNAIDSAQIAAGGVDDAHLATGISASKLTGALPAISGAALTGVATDLTSIRNDIATLALHTAIADNKAAFNLPNSFIDQFEDDTGLGTETDGDRNASEYWDTWVDASFSATGTLISTAQTANAAQTKVSGVILYKNAFGTATLGTDLKIYFTCNGGTNWTESTPAAAGTFSSGILMAKCPEVTCTSGTDVRYKAVWANMVAATPGSQSLIAQATGSIIGDFTGNSDKAFDGLSQSRSAGATRSASVHCYIGKDLGSGNEKRITGSSWQTPSDNDSVASGASITFRLYASNSAPSSYNDGTLLGTIGTEHNGTAANTVTSKLDFVNRTSYRYVWIHGQQTGSGVSTHCAEVKFYESAADTGGKETQLHGIGMNY